MKLIIGLTGFPLSGKGTVADMLELLIRQTNRTVSRHRFSDVLRATLDLWNMPHGRANEQRLAEVMDQFAPGTLSHAAESMLGKTTEEVAILDGIRWISDEEMLRRFSKQGIKNLIAYVSAGPDIRYARLEKRNRAGEAMTMREQFDRQNKAKSEIHIPEIGGRADFVIENNHDDIAKLQAEVKAAFEKYVLKQLTM